MWGMRLIFDLQGHRGARGLAPENTVPGFRTALAVGVSTLELDAAVTRDGMVVVAHDRRLSPDITRGPDGRWLEPPTPAVYELSVQELSRYDVGRIRPGSHYADRFPQQRAIDGLHMPRIVDVLALARLAPSVRFNIETKISPLAPHESTSPAAFVDLLLAAITECGVEDRVTIQSFDWRSLRLVRERAPHIPTVYLTAAEYQKRDGLWTDGRELSQHGSIARLIRAAAGPAPAVWSPDHRDVTQAAIREARALSLGVIPWTVNSDDEMDRMVDWGVTGFITDYPDRARRVLGARGIELPPPMPSIGA